MAKSKVTTKSKEKDAKVKEKAGKAAKVKKVKEHINKAAGLDFGSIYGDTLDVIARRQGVECSTLDIGTPLSTGMLCVDLQMGGGLRAGMYTSAGGEQSAKTTSALTYLANAIKENIPVLEWWDFEGSTKNSRPYVRAIVKGAGVKLTMNELFGKKDPETGKWIIRPRVKYHAESVGEKFFKYMAEVLRTMPDKKFVANRWWLRFDESKINHQKYDAYADNTMPKKYGKGIWVEAPDDKLQGIFFIDSWAACNTTANDEEDHDNSLAGNARMFSKHLPRIKGRLAEKMVALVGVNQLRDIPMARFGPKVQEPGGTALRFNSDVRTRNTSRASGYPLWAKQFNDEFEEVEKSVEFEGQYDRYRYIQTKAIKNKLWTPGRKAWIRIWVEDGSGTARGFCPFFDTMYYLKQTGQLEGKGRKGLTLNLHKLGTTKPLAWDDYKRWVLGDVTTMKKISAKAGLKKPISLRALCFKQGVDGVAEKLYLKMKDTKVNDKE